MKKEIESIAKLTNMFSRLPGVGRKTAERYCYKIIDMKKDEVEEFVQAINDVKDKVFYCSECGNFTDTDPCPICSERNKQIICVVAYPKDVVAFERVKEFDGVYHVLHGTISPLDGRGPDDIRIKQLLDRISKEDVQEVIMATNPDVEGEATAMYIARILKPLGVKVSRLAQGVAMGSDLEYADDVTLSHAFVNRKSM